MAEVSTSNFTVPEQYEIGKNNLGSRINIQASADEGGHNLHVRTRADRLSEEEESTAGALVVHKGGDHTPKGEDQPQDQLTELLAELGRIESQQDKLRDAVKHNRGIVVHPRQEVLDEESEHGDTPKAPTPKKKIIVSGGLTGFGIAQDLLQLDFSPPEEAPEEFKAVAFFEEPKQIKPGLSGSFGLCDPASKEMHHYLERLEEQQKLVLELITGKKQALLEQYANKGPSVNKGGKTRVVKSRLGRSGRLEETANKTAVANALGMSTNDKVASLGGKLESMALGGKGALASKMPMTLSTTVKPELAPVTSPAIKQRAVPPQVRQVKQAPARKAQVQKEDAEVKEQEEMKALFAKPLAGSTPSTSHLAGKSAAKMSHAAAVEAAEAQANPYYSSTPQKHVTPIAVPASPGGRVSTLGLVEEGEPQTAFSGGGEAKPGMFRGLKKIFSKNKA